MRDEPKSAAAASDVAWEQERAPPLPPTSGRNTDYRALLITTIPSIDSILKYTAENLIGRTLHNILEEFQNSSTKPMGIRKGHSLSDRSQENWRALKGIYGSLMEKAGYGIEPNSSPEADIPAAKVEIKTTPIPGDRERRYFRQRTLSPQHVLIFMRKT